MNIFVKTHDGAIAIVEADSVLEDGSIRKQLAAQDWQIGEKTPLIVSSTEFKSEKTAAKSNQTLSQQTISYPKFSLTDTPPIPLPQNADDIPPQYSTSTLIASNPDEQLMYCNPVTNTFYTVQDIRNTLNSSAELALNPPLPTYSLAYRCRWMQTDYQRITGPQHFQFTASTTEGMSQTDQQTFSEQLGVSLNGLSAGLSQTFSTTIQVSDANTVTHQYTVDVAADKITVWILWQLIYEVVAIDQSGDLLSYNGEVTFLGQPLNSLKIASNRATQGTSAYAPTPTSFDA